MHFLRKSYISTLEHHTDQYFLEGETSHIAGGEAPQNTATGTSQSGIEPVSGRLGRGEAGEPYDAGNVDGMLTQSRFTSFPRANTYKVLQDSVVRTQPPTTLLSRPPAAAQALDSEVV